MMRWIVHYYCERSFITIKMTIMTVLDETKAAIQEAAGNAWALAGRRGTIVGGTGVGKSKIAINELMGYNGKIHALIVTPTRPMRDETWPAEMKKWGVSDMLERSDIKIICYASLSREKGRHYTHVILDEIHWLTELNAGFFRSAQTGDNEGSVGLLSQFFATNVADAVMGLTATEPDPKRDPDKALIIDQIAPVCFRYSLDQGVEDGVIRDYEIRVIMMLLDRVNKNVKGGTKIKPFMTTEAAQYDYLSRSINKFRMLAANNPKLEKMVMFQTLARTRFIYNLPSKTALAKRVIAKEAPGKRTLVFCGSIAQCDALFGNAVYHSKSGKTVLDEFMNKTRDLMGCVNALNEGMNIDELEQEIIIQISSNERHLVQRAGRALRIGLDCKGIIYILCVQGTVDESWLKKSLAGFDENRIVYLSSLNYG